jgi:hypothetical protein
MAAVANQVQSTAQQIGARIEWNPIDAATQPPTGTRERVLNAITLFFGMRIFFVTMPTVSHRRNSDCHPSRFQTAAWREGAIPVVVQHWLS